MARSATEVLSPGTPGTTAPADWLPLVSVDDGGTPKPRVLSLRADRVLPQSGNPPANEFGISFLPAGAWWSEGWSADDCGAVRITTISETGVNRMIVADLRGGEFQIPPCSSVTVEIARYYAGGELAEGSFDFVVSGTLSDGLTSEVSPILLTAHRKWSANGGPGDSAPIIPPPGAYAFEIVAPIDAGFYETSHGVYRDRRSDGADSAAGLHLPASSPIPLVYPYLDVGPTQNRTASAAVVFFIR